MTSKQHTYANFGEYIYWSYANLQMLHYALNVGRVKYDRMCYMIRSKAFKAYKEGRWNIHDLLEFNVEKIRQNNYCWYCGKELEPSKLTKDHVFPRSKGGFLFIDIVDDSKEINKDFVYQDNKVFEFIHQVQDRTEPTITLIPHKINVEGKDLLVLEIPFSTQLHRTSRGEFLIRSNDGNRPIEPYEMATIMAEKGLIVYDQKTWHINGEWLDLKPLSKLQDMIEAKNADSPYLDKSQDES